MSLEQRPDLREPAPAGSHRRAGGAAGEPAPGAGAPIGLAGLAHVGALSFLVSRATPSGAFWLALAGGVALARAGERFGARRGYGASIAAMVQTVAYLGPARLNGPLTQAITAPMMGALERRGVGRLGQFLACSAGRLSHNLLATAFFIWVILGGLDAYAGTYDELLGRLVFLPRGATGALIATAASALAWTAVASAVQVHVYRRGLRRWHAADGGLPIEPDAREPTGAAPRRFDPRAVAVAAVLAFTLLIASTAAPLLAAVAAWLALAWALSRADREAVPAGLALTLLLAGGSLAFSLVGGLGLEVALRRAARAGLLVLVATWLRAAAGSDGVREVARRSLGRVRAIPAIPEAAAVLDELGTGRRLAPPGRALLAALGAARKRPRAMLDAVLAWITREASRFRVAAGRPPARLRLRPADGALVLLAAVPAVALLVA